MIPGSAGPTVGETGERRLIELLRTRFGGLDAHAGDDAALTDALDRPVLTVDSFFEGTHFYSWWAPADVLGRRLLEATLSDLAAMGATPTCCLVALALPKELPVQWLLRLYDGLFGRAEECSILGGEIVRSSVFGITITAVGNLEGAAAPLRRCGVKPGDGVYVAGRVGRALDAPGLLERCGGLSGDPLEPARKDVVLSSAQLEQLQCFLHPSAQLSEGAKLRHLGIEAAIDVSDGVLSEARHLARESGVDIEIDAEALPLFDSVVGRPLEAAAAGEDFVLMFSAPNDFDASSCGFDFLPVNIGRAAGESGGGHLFWVNESGRVELTDEDSSRTGYDHFG